MKCTYLLFMLINLAVPTKTDNHSFEVRWRLAEVSSDWQNVLNAWPIYPRVQLIKCSHVVCRSMPRLHTRIFLSHCLVSLGASHSLDAFIACMHRGNYRCKEGWVI